MELVEGGIVGALANHYFEPGKKGTGEKDSQMELLTGFAGGILGVYGARSIMGNLSPFQIIIAGLVGVGLYDYFLFVMK
jgi:hypothetical protein